MHGSQHALQALQREVSILAMLSLSSSHQQVYHYRICCPCFLIRLPAFHTYTAALDAPEQRCHHIMLVASLPAALHRGILAIVCQ